MPGLSSSLESTSSSDSDHSFTTTHLPKARPELRYTECAHEKHITPTDLEKFVISIQQSKALEQKPIDLPISTPAIPPMPLSSASSPPQEFTPIMLDSHDNSEQLSDSTAHPPSVTESQNNFLESSASTVDTNEEEKASQSFSSDGSSNTEMSTHSIIRGFVPGGAPSSYRSQTNLAAQPTPILKTVPHKHAAQPKKKGPMFTIGTSSGEDESSLESHMFRSALSESLKRPAGPLGGSSSRKQTSFKDEIAIGRAAEHSPVFESDDEDEEVSESAIEDDDDSSDWEDSEDMSAHSSVNEKDLFQRVDSRPNLTSRRSLLTTLMHEPDRAKALANAASRSTPAMRRSRTATPNGPSVATSPESGTGFGAAQQGTAARPIIMTTSNTHNQLALSPRSTRRNMLSTELTESLRKNLLWERQHKSTGNLGALRKRYLSNDGKNLKQAAEPGPVLSQPEGGKKFTNDYFHAGLQEFHAKGW